MECIFADPKLNGYDKTGEMLKNLKLDVMRHEARLVSKGAPQTDADIIKTLESYLDQINKRRGQKDLRKPERRVQKDLQKLSRLQRILLERGLLMERGQKQSDYCQSGTPDILEATTNDL